MSQRSDDLLQEIKERCGAATSGPWEAVENTVTCDGTCAAICFAPAVQDCIDAEFIAHARSDIPALLARIEHLESDFGSYVYHTTDGHLSRPYDVAMLCTLHDDRVTALVAEECENEREQYATDKAALIEALEDIAERFLFQSSDFDSIILTKTDEIHIRTVLARVKEPAP